VLTSDYFILACIIIACGILSLLLLLVITITFTTLQYPPQGIYVQTFLQRILDFIPFHNQIGFFIIFISPFLTVNGFVLWELNFPKSHVLGIINIIWISMTAFSSLINKKLVIFLASSQFLVLHVTSIILMIAGQDLYTNLVGSSIFVFFVLFWLFKRLQERFSNARTYGLSITSLSFITLLSFLFPFVVSIVTIKNETKKSNSDYGIIMGLIVSYGVLSWNFLCYTFSKRYRLAHDRFMFEALDLDT